MCWVGDGLCFGDLIFLVSADYCYKIWQAGVATELFTLTILKIAKFGIPNAWTRGAKIHSSKTQHEFWKLKFCSVWVESLAGNGWQDVCLAKTMQLITWVLATLLLNDIIKNVIKGCIAHSPKTPKPIIGDQVRGCRHYHFLLLSVSAVLRDKIKTELKQ